MVNIDVKPIRALDRGLAVLAALNRRSAATALELARDTGLPRASVYRVLRTLLDGRYITRSPSDDRFLLTLRVRHLSDGFEDEQWLGAVAAPAIFDLTRKIHWPCDVTTLEGTHMIIRETTHRFAPMSIDRGMAGRQIPLLKSSAGLAYLAFTRPSERTLLLGLLAKAGEHMQASALERELRTIRKQGFSVRQGGSLWPHSGSIAMPIRHEGKLLGCAALIWMSSAVSAKDGIAQCAGPLADTVRAMERRLQRESSV